MIRAGCWDCGPWRDGHDFLTIRTAGWLRRWALPKLGVTCNANTNVQKTMSRLASQAIGTAIFVLWACSLTLAATAPSTDSKPEKTRNLAGKTLVLTLKEAVQIGLTEDGNTRVLLAMQYVRQAKAQTAIERANLLPNIDASLIQQNRTTNLEAIGINFSLIPPSFRPPTFVGPFHHIRRARERQPDDF